MDTGIKLMLGLICLEALCQFHLAYIADVIAEVDSPKNCLSLITLVTCSTETKQLSILLLTLMALSFVPVIYAIFKFVNYIRDKDDLMLKTERKKGLIDAIDALMINKMLLTLGIIICLLNSLGLDNSLLFLKIYIPYLIFY